MQFDIYAENASACEVFRMASTQWRLVVGGMDTTIVVGLDYAGVEAVIRLLGIPEAERPELMVNLRVMEAAAIKTLNKKLARERPDSHS